MARKKLGSPASCFRWRSLKQVGRLDTERHRQPVQHVDAHTINTTFKRADIGAVDVGLMRKFLLRQAALLSVDAQIAGEHLSDIHTMRGRRIVERSILDKTLALASLDLALARRFVVPMPSAMHAVHHLATWNWPDLVVNNG